MDDLLSALFLAFAFGSDPKAGCVIPFIIIVSLVILGGYLFASNNQKWDDQMKVVAEQCFEQEEDLTTTIRGIPTTATYESDKTATVVSVEVENGRTYQKVDINKSYLVGKYAGEKSKEVVKGFWKGIFNKDE